VALRQERRQPPACHADARCDKQFKGHRAVRRVSAAGRVQPERAVAWLSLGLLWIAAAYFLVRMPANLESRH
jgi:hypothetical protein